MPPRRQKQSARRRTHHAFNVYTSQEFNDVAQELGFTARSGRSKRNWQTVMDALIERWNQMPLPLKRYYEYQLEKHHPIRPDRYNSWIHFKYMRPNPESVAKASLSVHITKDQQGKILLPDRDNVVRDTKASLGPMQDVEDEMDLREIYCEALRSRGYLDQNIPPRPVCENPDDDSEEYSWFTPAEWRMMRDNLTVPGQGTRWTFHRFLLPLPNRQVGVWRRVNAHNMPISEDRRVFKVKIEQMYPNPPPPTEELGDEEGIIHELIYGRCPEFVPRIFNYGCHDYDKGVYVQYTVKMRMAYLELEWMPHGDLWGLMKYYEKNEKILPEPFIWYVFFAMVKVAVHCLNGQLSNTKDPEWDRICHLDIKPDNIFLGAPNPNNPMKWARVYPVPKIGDWEMAYITTALYQGDPDDDLEWPRNPQDLQGSGTTGYMPPELLSRKVDDLYRQQEWDNAFADPEATLARVNELMPCDPTQQPFPPPDAKCGIDSWTTVWQIGMVIWVMLSGNTTTNDDVVDFAAADRSRDYPDRVFRLDGPLRPLYSGRLVELAYACLHADPAERIDVWDLFREVRDGCQDVGRELKKKKGKDREGLLVDGAVPVSVAPDKYPVAAAVLNDTPPVPLRPV